MTFLPTSSFDALGAPLQSASERLVPFIGERVVSLFQYAIADETDSLAYAVPLRKALIDRGEDPDNPQVTETEQLLIDWGRLIVSSPAEIPADVTARVESAFSPALRALLLAFASTTIAATVYATVGGVPLDEALYAYRKPGDDRTS